MDISAQVSSRQGSHEISLTTNQNTHSIEIAPRPSGFGSSANGAELLFLALATCYCNDIYREAGKRGITVRSVRVQVSGTFGDAPGSRAENVTYNAAVEAEASEAEIVALMRHTDTVAEIQNTLRAASTVVLGDVQAVSVQAG